MCKAYRCCILAKDEEIIFILPEHEITGLLTLRLLCLMFLSPQHCGTDAFAKGKGSKVGEGIYVGTALSQVKDGKVSNRITTKAYSSPSFSKKTCVVRCRFGPMDRTSGWRDSVQVRRGAASVVTSRRGFCALTAEFEEIHSLCAENRLASPCKENMVVSAAVIRPEAVLHRRRIPRF